MKTFKVFGLSLTVCWLCICTALPVQSQALTQREQDDIFQGLSAMSLLRAAFLQTKTIAALDREYLSGGEIVFHRQYGILWQLRHPVAAQLIVGRDRIVQQTENTHSVIEMSGSPYAGIAQVLLQVMAGDQQQLRENFQLLSAERLSNGHWQIALEPKDKRFQRLFNAVVLSGSEFVEEIVLKESSGNQTRLQFSQQRLLPEALSDGEDALFQLAQ